MSVRTNILLSARTNILLSVAALSGLLTIGCSGAPDGGAVGATSSLGDGLGSLGNAQAVLAPLEVWDAAPVGCEGRLPQSGVTVTGAFGAPELRVVFTPGENGDAHAVCTDTVASLGTELHLRGLVAMPAASGSDGQPLQAFPTYAIHRNDEGSGDPSPQPSQPTRYVPSTTVAASVSSPTSGDPSPQPSTHNSGNMGTTDGDPSPQPSQPRDATHH